MGGLVLTRKFGEAVVIGGDVTVRVLRGEDRSDRVRLHIDAPRETLILREEIAGEPDGGAIDIPGFEWVSWWDFVRDLLRGARRYNLAGLTVLAPRGLGVVQEFQTFPDTDDPELVVLWGDGERESLPASQVEWKVSA